MGSLDENAKEFYAIFISIKEVLDLILQDDENNEPEHIKNTINARFFSKQTCLIRDGYDVEVIKIDRASEPSYQIVKQAISQYLDGQNSQNPLLTDYGFSRKRTLSNLISMEIKNLDELLVQAKSFTPYCDNDDNIEPYLDCLPYEYEILHKEYELLSEKYQKLENNSVQLLDNEDGRTVNNFLRLLLAINQLKTPFSFDREYNKAQLDIINKELDLLGYKQLGETAYKTLVEMIKQAKTKGL